MRRKVLAIWMLLACLPASASTSEFREKLRITLTAQYYPPYIDSAAAEAPLTRIVTNAFRLANVDVALAEVPNNRAISGVMQGLYEGSYGWGHTSERSEKLLYSAKPIFDLRVVFFHRNGEEFPWEQLSDLKTVTIGAVQGNFYSPEFSSLQSRGVLKTDLAPSDISNFRKLLGGRVDLVPIDAGTGQLILQKHFTAAERSRISMQNKAIAVVPVYVVINKKLPRAAELMKRFDAGFQQLSESGQLTKILEASKVSAPAGR